MALWLCLASGGLRWCEFLNDILLPKLRFFYSWIVRFDNLLQVKDSDIKTSLLLKDPEKALKNKEALDLLPLDN
jgi:hypothetical protein